MNILEPQAPTVAERTPLYRVPQNYSLPSPPFGVWRPVHALALLVEQAEQDFTDANYKAEGAAYRLSLGARCFNEDELATAQSELDAVREIVARLTFWRLAASWGAPLEDWRAHEGELQARLDTKATDPRYAGLRAEDLLRALVCDDE